MKLHFDAQQTYQLDAIRAVVDLFAGQPAAAGTFEWQTDLPERELLDTLGVANALALTESVGGRRDSRPAKLLGGNGNGHGQDLRLSADDSRTASRLRPR